MVTQGALTVIAPIDPNRLEALQNVFRQMVPPLGDVVINSIVPFGKLSTLHFGRFVILEATETTPLQLSFSTNYDGLLEDHLYELDREAGSGLGLIFSHCLDFHNDVRAFIQAHCLKPGAFYIGHRGRSRRQIGQEASLRNEIRRFLDANCTATGEPLHNQSRPTIRSEIQEHIRRQPRFAWAVEEPGLPVNLERFIGLLPSIGMGASLVLLWAILTTVLQVATIPNPSLIFIWNLYWKVTVCLIPLISCVIVYLKKGLINPVSTKKTPWLLYAGMSILTSFGLSMGLKIGPGLLVALLILTVLTGLIILIINRGLKYLNTLEEQEPKPVVASKEHVANLLERENLVDYGRVVVQNQLTHLVAIKPERFRVTTLKFVLWVINLAAIVEYYKGELGGIPSIHFAQWVLIDDHKRLIFYSNFDGSWENYLGDFTDKASDGLTGVWSNTVGFPRAHNLIGLGARDEQRFKEWARENQIETQVWYSAYPDLSVSNINNNTRIRSDLFRSLSDKAVDEWFRRF
jgi:hypothetical protein